MLDVGCGNGVVSAKLKKSLKINLTGCDVINYLSHDIQYVKMQNKEKLPFNKYSFDVTMFNDVLHHTEKENQLKLLDEAFRVSKRILIFEVQPTIRGKIFDYLLNKIHNLGMNIPFAFRTIDEWQLLFKKKGYKFKTESISSPFLYPFKHIAFLLEK